MLNLMRLQRRKKNGLPQGSPFIGMFICVIGNGS
jgi:hypothetical protein